VSSNSVSKNRDTETTLELSFPPDKLPHLWSNKQNGKKRYRAGNKPGPHPEKKKAGNIPDIHRN